ncbi:Vms1/Ankzf1 family peptidyl-tRNA hydrolase [Halovivax sp.]|uniref:Vms1/Ankzf1 family peptidyl-tRNA hydrolase n=1 Tax=Halovivax sp. TaxID=1935978 RepID=UPI0025C66FFA|nr:Vms1/Ankzf1 family peptidyl-tRNA hydrolase [Halovivax sp.]
MSRLDEWLGRAPLKERIAELEAELERQRDRYEAESERRAEAVRERQTAQERINRLEDRIAQLEGELDRVDDDERRLEYRRRERLRGERLREVLDRLRSVRAGPEGILTASVDGGSLPETVSDALGDRARLAAEAAPCLVCVDDAGLLSVALDAPTAPSIEPTWDDRVALDPSWFRPTGSFLLALVRADLFALGRYEGDERVDYVGFESDVKGAHSKGGFSQARFERIREGQIDDHLERSREAIAEALSAAEADRLYLVGQRNAVDELAADLETPPEATMTVDATGAPESALDDAFRSFWTAELRVI